MQTLKIKYHTNKEEDLNLIRQYQKQYSNTLKWMYNRCVDGIGDTKRKQLAKTTLNNIPLMECWFISSASKDANAKYIADPRKRIIFGGKKNFIRRCKGLITKEEWQKCKLMPLCSIGEANQKGNRKFKLTEDLSKVIFKPSANTHIELIFNGLGKNYRKTLRQLYLLQESKATPITYYLDDEYVFISFDEVKMQITDKRKVIENRVMAIDLNPNYIGWSIVDWNENGKYNVVKYGVYSIKDINDKEFNLKNLPSNDKRKIYLSNKRNYEVMQISKNLINKALYYGCETFVCEGLTIDSSDKGKGKKFNRLCNNLWCRDKLVNNLKKRCNLFNITFNEVKPEYSSFVGNILYRKHKLPDMVLASIEIGRRGYEFVRQYIKKDKEIKKNIILPEIKDFVEDYVKSLEEFGVIEKSIKMVDLYYLIKKSKIRYRFSLDDWLKEPHHLKFLRCFSKRSLILKISN